MKVGRFRLNAALAAGAAGTVWRARHVSGHPAAVKLLRRVDHAERFELELDAICQLHHPNIVQVYDAGTVTEEEGRQRHLTAGVRWMAMELVEGGTVHDRRHGDWADRREVLAGLLRGLAHAHAAGLVHRDVKPPNLLWDGAVRLADFGITSPIGQSPERVMGTPAFMAPEQLKRGARLGPWTDLYAAGGVGWWLATGRLAYPLTDARALMRAQLSEPLPAFSSRLDVPPELEAWLRWLLDKRPDRRPATAAEALAALPGVSSARARTPTTLLAGAGLVGLRRTPMVGRADEREQLVAALADPQVRAVVIQGPAGVGKTRLAAWLLRRSRELGLAEGLTIHGSNLVDALTDAESRRAAGKPVSLDAEAPPGALLEALGAWAGGPVVLHLDDPGPAEVELAGALLDSDRARGLLVLTVRDGALAPDALQGLLARPDAHAIHLEPLADDEQLQLAGELLELEPSLLRVVAERTGGNPLYLLQLIAQGVADDVLEPGPWGHRLRRGARLGIPEDLRTSCASLADSLPSSWRDPLLLAALLGPDVDETTWTRAAGQVPAGLLPTLERRKLARRRPGGWRFAHALWREVLVEQAADRADLHRACADALDGPPARRAPHLVRGERFEEAVAELDQAIRDTGEDAPLRRELVTLLGESYDALGRDSEEDQLFRMIHDVRTLAVEGREDLLLPRIRQALPRVRALDKPEWTVELMAQAGRASLDSGAPELAREQLHRAVDLGRETSSRMHAWAAHQAAWAECVLGAPSTALDLVRAGRDAQPWPILDAHLRAAASYAHALRGDPEAAWSELEGAIQTLGDDEQERIRMDTHAVLIEVLSGQPDAAMVRARAALEACRIGRLRQHLLSMVCALEANRDAHRDLAHRATRLARNARETYDVRHQASAVLHVLGLAEPDEIARLDQAVVLDPLVLQTLSTASDDRSKAWHAAMTARLER